MFKKHHPQPAHHHPRPSQFTGERFEMLPDLGKKWDKFCKFFIFGPIYEAKYMGVRMSKKWQKL